jgi:phenylpyruvate tautomerase PptA (4-oxalocrotonate tautomerase family)
MPIVQISSNVALSTQEKEDLLTSVARLVSEAMEKPIQDVMVSFTAAEFAMAGSFEPTAFIDLRCLSGLQVEGMRARLCQGMLDILQQHAPVDPARVYVNFFEVRPDSAWRFRDGVAVCPKSVIGAR